jgi:hypothetical protein
MMNIEGRKDVFLFGILPLHGINCGMTLPACRRQVVVKFKGKIKEP